MTNLHPKKQPKAPAKTKINGTVSSSNAHYITLQTARGAVWKIAKTPKPKVTGTLNVGSKVTIEFSKKDGRQIKLPPPPENPIRAAGKRTEETGRVIGLTAAQVTLDNTTPDPGTWIISQTDGQTWVVSGTLALGATNVHLSFLVPPGQRVANA